jgi:divalent metal cation (Fe/Co/Zn/Cd) transporter
MHFARAMAMACLSVMQALFWFIAALLLVLTVVQALRGDVDRQPSKTMALGAGFAVAGLVCRYASKRFEAGK